METKNSRQSMFHERICPIMRVDTATTEVEAAGGDAATLRARDDA